MKRHILPHYVDNLFVLPQYLQYLFIIR